MPAEPEPAPAPIRLIRKPDPSTEARYRAHWSKNENADDVATDTAGVLERREKRQAAYLEIAKE